MTAAVSEETRTEKRRLRAAARAIGAGTDRARARARAIAFLAMLDEIRAARRVALYAGAGDEVPAQDLHATLRQAGIEVAFPLVDGEDLLLRRVDRLEDLEHGFRGLLEPRSICPWVGPEEVEVFVVPGVLFDRAGRRLGRGGGHYDRLLARARPEAFRVGLCYADRVVPELPVEPWDVRVDAVVTEEGIARTPSGGRSGGCSSMQDGE